MRVLDRLLSWLEVWKVCFLVRAGAWLVFLLSRAMVGASPKLEIKHKPACSAVTGTYLVPVQVIPGRTTPGSEGVGVVINRYLPAAVECPECCAGDLGSPSQLPHGRNDGRHQHGSFQEKMFQLSNDLPLHAFCDYLNLHVLTPMWMTMRLTSLFLGMCASQWLMPSMARPKTLRFWL